MFYLALGYFISYLPCALVAKALSSGIVPGFDRPVGGLVLLPAAALGQLLAMPIFLGTPGWWRFASEQRVGHLMTMASAGVTVGDHRHTAALIQQAVQRQLAERFL